MASHTRRNVRQVYPGDGYLAVFTDPRDGGIDSDAGPLVVRTDPVEFVALVECQEADARTGEPIDAPWTELLAVDLCGGTFEPMAVEEVRNYHGVVRADATHDQILHLLPGGMVDRVVECEEADA